MKEYDFRLPGIDQSQAPAETRVLRDAILELAGGFTEIGPGVLTDLIPGPGTGYIVALEAAREAFVLQRRIRELASAWALPAPSIRPASRGPRGKVCYFLLPEFANPEPDGYRRRLLSEERIAAVETELLPSLVHPIIRVYGEWKPRFSVRQLDSDVSFIYIVRWRSHEDERQLRSFIETRIFDKSGECDQETIYLSVRGVASYVYPQAE